ncbi:Type III effector HopPmaJ [hydrothermal vent metagenome]|uniref:Type III effector HopPmaJ n=1 Tax=hydrothermal vent metagenome TaxID=652676 RepID=A0A3B0WIK1_9ZZZZ
MDNLSRFVEKIKLNPEKIEFKKVIEIIDKYYLYTPTRFSNGENDAAIINNAGENEGSCKIFSFAQMYNLDNVQTLNCFGTYYREDVLQHLEGSNHANIRTFIKHGWKHIHFDGTVLKRKQR